MTSSAFLGYPEEVRLRLDADAEAILARYPQPRSALMPLLHLVQSEDGYVSPAGIAWCADVLGLSRANVSAVATFYSQYKRRPNGTYTVGICTNTLCAVMGGDAIFERVSQRLGIHHDETTEDGSITLEQIECNAACDYAPVMMVNWEFFDNQTPESALAVVDAILEGRDVHPTRGPDTVPTFQQMERVLAGFEDGLADEGNAGGAATMVGLALSREHGWSAPAVDPARLQADDADAVAQEESADLTEGHRDQTARAASGEGNDGSVNDRDENAATETPGSGAVGEAGSSAEHEATTEADVDPQTVAAPAEAADTAADEDSPATETDRPQEEES